MHIHSESNQDALMDMSSPPTPDTALQAEQQVLLDALDSLLLPLAQLCVGKGITIQMLEPHLRGSFVKAARQAYVELPGNRLTSRISATTGLTRREVSRLESQRTPPREPRHSPVTELFTRWLSDPALRTSDGQPIALPRQGSAPSFESLAHSVTRDVHPRTLMEELCRLRLAEHDLARDTVCLLHGAFVPQGDWARMVAYLGDNVGDHLRAATANVLGNGQRHLEQAIYADELSERSLAIAREFMTEHWRAMLAQIAPRLHALMDDDRAAGRPQNQSMRIGLFTWSQPMPSLAPDPNVPPEEIST